MATSLSDILAALQNGVTAINRLGNIVSVIFPEVTSTSTSAPSAVGAITFSSSLATGFMLVELSSGATVKVPYYTQ